MTKKMSNGEMDREIIRQLLAHNEMLRTSLEAKTYILDEIKGILNPCRLDVTDEEARATVAMLVDIRLSQQAMIKNLRAKIAAMNEELTDHLINKTK